MGSGCENFENEFIINETRKASTKIHLLTNELEPFVNYLPSSTKSSIENMITICHYVEMIKKYESLGLNIEFARVFSDETVRNNLYTSYKNFNNAKFHVDQAGSRLSLDTPIPIEDLNRLQILLNRIGELKSIPVSQLIILRRKISKTLEDLNNLTRCKLEFLSRINQSGLNINHTKIVIEVGNFFIMRRDKKIILETAIICTSNLEYFDSFQNEYHQLENLSNKLKLAFDLSKEHHLGEIDIHIQNLKDSNWLTRILSSRKRDSYRWLKSISINSSEPLNKVLASLFEYREMRKIQEKVTREFPTLYFPLIKNNIY